MFTSRLCTWLVAACALIVVLSGCKKAEQNAASSSAPSGDPRIEIQKRLNDPNVSAQEKEQIRRQYGGTGYGGGR